MTAWKTLRDYIPPTQHPFDEAEKIASNAAVARRIKVAEDYARDQAEEDAAVAEADAHALAAQAEADEAQAAANIAHILALSPPVDEVPVVEAEDLVGDTAPRA